MESQTTKTTLAVGTQIGRFEIREILGIGGFGITYKAWDPMIKRMVAIKEYLPADAAVRANDTIHVQAHESRFEDYQFGLDRFLKEAEILGKFPHPNIVGVHDYFPKNNTAYLIMTFEQGQTLSQHFKDQGGWLKEDELKALFRPILKGLEHIHKQDYYHRDIKPSNIYLRDQGEPVLIDFGAARQALGTRSRSLTSIVSPGYAPSEQYGSDQKKQGSWSDLYAVGATLYYCISGFKPIDAPTRKDAIYDGEDDPLVPAIIRGKGRYTLHFLKLIDWMLQPAIRERPQTVRAVLEWLDQNPDAGETPSTALRKLTSGRSEYRPSKRGQAENDRPAKQTETGLRKRRPAKLIAGAVGLVLLVLISIVLQFTKSEQQPKIPGATRPTKPTEAVNVEALVESRVQQELEGRKQQQKLAQQREKAQTDALARQQIEEDHRQQERIRQRTLATLLAEAAKDIQQLRLSSPKGNNAVEKYREVLRADPQNQVAQQGLNTVVDKYLDLAQKAQDNDRYAKAANHFGKAKSIVPNYPALQEAEENLETAKQAYEREQERLLEIGQHRQAKAASQKGQPRSSTDPYTGMQFVAVNPGCFRMGSNSSYDNEKPVHRVCLTQGYYLGKYEVTQAQWQKVMGDNPSNFKGSNKPVETVSWNDIQTFIRKLNQQTGKNYRLPTEAEWEYACRSGGQNQKYCGSDSIDSVAWYYDNSGNTTHTVGQKQPNGLGLYDMSGNVWEWAQDGFKADYYSSSSTNSPKGPSGGSYRVFRGGGWDFPCQWQSLGVSRLL